MGGLGHELRVLGAHKVVGEGGSQHPGGLSRDSKLGVVGAQGMGLELEAQTLAHLEHLGPARKDIKRFGDMLRREAALSQDQAGSFLLKDPVR